MTSFEQFCHDRRNTDLPSLVRAYYETLLKLDASTALLERAQELLNDGAENTDDPSIHLAVDTVAAAVWLRDMAALVVERTDTDVRCGNHRCNALLSAGEPHVEGCLGGDNDARAAVGLAPAVERPGPRGALAYLTACFALLDDDEQNEFGVAYELEELRDKWRKTDLEAHQRQCPHGSEIPACEPCSALLDSCPDCRELFEDVAACGCGRPQVGNSATDEEGQGRVWWPSLDDDRCANCGREYHEHNVLTNECFARVSEEPGP